MGPQGHPSLQSTSGGAGVLLRRDGAEIRTRSSRYGKSIQASVSDRTHSTHEPMKCAFLFLFLATTGWSASLESTVFESPTVTLTALEERDDTILIDFEGTWSMPFVHAISAYNVSLVTSEKKQKLLEALSYKGMPIKIRILPDPLYIIRGGVMIVDFDKVDIIITKVQ